MFFLLVAALIQKPVCRQLIRIFLHICILHQIRYASRSHHIFVHQKLPSVAGRILRQHVVRSVRHNVGIARVPKTIVAEQHLDGRRVDHGARPKGIDGNAIALELFGHAQNAHGHSVFGHCVGDIGAKPAGAHVQRWRDVEDVRVVALLQIRKAFLGAVGDAREINDKA